MHYTDLGVTYQILLGKDGSQVFTDGSLKATTHIDTPFDVWVSISRGEIGGAEALGKQMYTVTGDFSLMIEWDHFFTSGTNTPTKETDNSKNNLKNPSMVTMLIPWITFWIAVSIVTGIGAVIAIVVSALVPLIMHRYQFVIWDQLSIAVVAVLSAIAHVVGDGKLPINIGYLIFGMFWLFSCLTKEPLCAAYVKYNYGGDDAHKNPLFMKANYILAACWGVLYVLTAIWTWLLQRIGFGAWIVIINNLMPMGMGVFTAWFEKWYPAWKARGSKE